MGGKKVKLDLLFESHCSEQEKTSYRWEERIYKSDKGLLSERTLRTNKQNITNQRKAGEEGKRPKQFTKEDKQ